MHADARDTPHVFLNAKAHQGGAPDEEAITAAFATHGVTPHLHAIGEGEDLCTHVRTAIDAGPHVVAAGGDGTVNAVAGEVLGREGVALGILPAGTLNHFARDLGIPMELADAAGVIAAGHLREVDVGEANGRVFLNNASLGLYARMVETREQLQAHQHLGKWRAMVRASMAVLRHPRTFGIELQADGAPLHRRTPFVFVGNNRYTLSGLQAGGRSSLADGVLAVYVLRPMTAWGLLWLVLRTLLGRGDTGRDLERLSVSTLVVDSHHACDRLARGGEVDPVDTPVRFSVRPRALRVLAPALEAAA